MSETHDFIKDVEEKVEKFLKAKKELEVAKTNLDKILDQGRGLSSKISEMLLEQNDLNNSKEEAKAPVKKKVEKISKEESLNTEEEPDKEKPKLDSTEAETPKIEKSLPKKEQSKNNDSKIIESKKEESVNTDESSVKDTKEEKQSNDSDDSMKEFEDIFGEDDFSELGLDFTLDANLSDSDVDNIEL